MTIRMHQETVGREDEWLTPQYILDKLGPFDLDPASPKVRPWPTAENHFTIDDDGLSKEWFGRVWLNPPYNRNTRPIWMEKMARHKNGIMLIPAAVETEAFKTHVWSKCAAVLMLDHRPFFHRVDGTRGKSNCGGALCLVAYDEANVRSLLSSGLGVVVKEIKTI